MHTAKIFLDLPSVSVTLVSKEIQTQAALKLMNVCPVHVKMVAHVLIKSTATTAHASLDMRVQIVKSILMNASTIQLARTVVPV
jgi:hypothetical protein